MPEIQAIHPVTVPPASVYNGVKIRINNPVVVIPDCPDNSNTYNNYNAVDIKVNNPKVLPENFVYNYKNAERMITADMAGITPVNIPQMPAPASAYQAAAAINEPEVNKSADEFISVATPAPNITTFEAEKKTDKYMVFNGLDNVEIVPPSNAKPEININDVISKLSDKNFDVQAIQLEKIANTAITEPVKAVPYIVTDVYSSLLDIMKLDTTAYEKPSENQIETRKKIILNQIYLEQALEENQDPNTVELPFKLTKEEISEAVRLSPFEQAERNKEYALLTSAFLTKIYIDETEKELEKIIPLTDLPCVSEYAEVLRHGKNPDTKIAAINALIYLQRPEYNSELNAIFELTENFKS